MGAMKEYTIELYKRDRRVKEGRRLLNKIDFHLMTRDSIEVFAENYRREGMIAEIHETFVTRTNLMGGKEYQERYDTPRCCSPSSEAYWSM